MSFASSYVLASKVRSKLTRQAADPKSSLRSLVLQANMLDNIMDHIATKTEKVKSDKVTFSLPEPRREPVASGPSVTEYEVDSDSDSDMSDSEFDSDSYGFEYSLEEEDDDFYYSSDEEDTARPLKIERHHSVKHVGDERQLLVIFEDEENELPELTHLVSTSDSESEDELHTPNYVLTLKSYEAFENKVKEPVLAHGQSHQRHHAIYSIESVF